MMTSGWTPADRTRLEELRAAFRANGGRTATRKQSQEMFELHRREHENDVRRFGDFLGWLTRVILHYDPADLDQFGVPEDEYDVEARYILRELAAVQPRNLAEVCTIVHEVFVLLFDGDTCGPVDRPCFVEIARSLWDNKQKWQGK